MESFDFAIIGAGAAGLNLALKMASDSFFDQKKILILDKNEKNGNDKTWSFWERGVTQWDSITFKTWDKALFYSKNQKFEFKLNPYRYKTIRSNDFYNYSKGILQKKSNIQWDKNEVINVNEHEIICSESSYHAIHIFDSRVNNEFHSNSLKHNSLLQHFKGWIIETPENTFDPTSFTMMDYRLNFEDKTSFTYVLPFSPDKALVEFTLFNLNLLTDEQYEEMLNTYISQFLKINSFKISEVEKGVIPMSDYPFHIHHASEVTKIGTAGGWVRPSSGYSFKNADKYSQMMVNNIKNGSKINKGVARNRFRKYDQVFLNVLKNHNSKGSEIFTKFYTNHPIQKLFRFLDEESSLMEDLQIILSYNNKEFRKAALQFFK